MKWTVFVEDDDLNNPYNFKHLLKLENHLDKKNKIDEKGNENENEK
jgi:hypothetical protein